MFYTKHVIFLVNFIWISSLATHVVTAIYEFFINIGQILGAYLILTIKNGIKFLNSIRKNIRLESPLSQSWPNFKVDFSAEFYFSKLTII